MNSSNCFACLTPKQLAIIQTQLLCEILSALSVNVTCGTSDPTLAPDGTCAIYYRKDSGRVWVWNNVTSAWVPIVAT